MLKLVKFDNMDNFFYKYNVLDVYGKSFQSLSQICVNLFRKNLIVSKIQKLKKPFTIICAK